MLIVFGKVVLNMARRTTYIYLILNGFFDWSISYSFLESGLLVYYETIFYKGQLKLHVQAYYDLTRCLMRASGYYLTLADFEYCRCPRLNHRNEWRFQQRTLGKGHSNRVGITHGLTQSNRNVW